MRWLPLVLLAGCGVSEPGLSVHVTVQVGAPLSAQAASLAIEEVELVPCAVARPWWQALSPVSTAYAHGVEAANATPRRLVSPVLLDLTRAEAQDVAHFAPPPGALCAVKLTFAPSTADARAQGTTLFLEQPPVRQVSTKRYVVTKAFEARALDEASRELELSLRLEAAQGADGDETLRVMLGTLAL